ncbi:type IV pilus biogenesis/stability protein PilW [Nitrosomonas sp. Nm166]|uniref:type IV pilus biogenesis/stability protein PilW n=1 Tax=Nitrosomonas sp. Nm166 TaxID=1881054 RepID=UPI0008E1ED5E|nr:type IV pilus biogenesis/stability protein PilW [Nitrosomonas sp. Nm166]SFE52619.1 type IV pilus assembly protein PilF [Nitrosomonas sp. Nm166]
MKKILLAFIWLHLLWLSACIQQPIAERASDQAKSDRAYQSAKIHTELAAEYFNRGQLNVAIEEVMEALKAQSNYAPAYNVLGLINMALNENNKALDNFEQAIRLAPKNSEIHNNYGWFLCQRFPQRIDQAINHFMVAAKDPLYLTPEMAFANAGVCELKRQKYHEAQIFLQKALSIQPNFSPALMGLIDMDFQRGNLVEAKSKLVNLLQNNVSTPESLLLAIQIEQAIGDQLAADSYIFQLQKYFPDSKEAATVREERIR